ncbi:hypothetical protein KIPB_008039 [Kipferlia bialata]|uniref:Uncharacterized protein n=1 Tax=Kipferlia bialata TaxID=797122 RepID=A0A391NQP5_9EUKA|nr:hypothetical protein KIPB_008039 [Kipferlia bialata]|eukprot:g8039.t1
MTFNERTHPPRLFTYTERGGVIAAALTDWMPRLHMATMGRHIFLYRPDVDGVGFIYDEPGTMFSYSTVSGEFTEYEGVSALLHTEKLCQAIGDGVVLFVSSDVRSGSGFFSATVPLPGGDDYESAGRWNVMDADHH